jgi:hypothetical protein
MKSHFIFFAVNCWPSENSNGGCDVNIEYELQDGAMELLDVTIVVPVAGNPVVNSCDGDYEAEPRKGRIVWTLPVVDSANRTGAMEFSTNTGTSDDFFPVSVSFASKRPYMELKVIDELLNPGFVPTIYLALSRMKRNGEPACFIDHTCEDGRFPVSADCVTVSNPDSLSSSETRANPWIRS